jgi:transposase
MTMIKFIGLDVHKDTIAVAVADDGHKGEVRFYGTIPNTPEAVRRLVHRLTQPGVELSFCYEAGACGYGVHRQLAQLGAECLVIAPSMTPRRPGERIKTDRRDAITLARLLRAGELTAVWVPDEGHEAVRDLVRARRQAKDDLTAAKLTVELSAASGATLPRPFDLEPGALALAGATSLRLDPSATRLRGGHPAH